MKNYLVDAGNATTFCVSRPQEGLQLLKSKEFNTSHQMIF